MESQQKLQGKKVAALMTEGFEQAEYVEPRKALENAGATVHVVSLKSGEIKAWDDTDWGDTFPVDLAIDAADPSQYDALLLPGGVMNPDKLRMEPKAVQFVKHFFDQKKPVGAICHGPWLLAEANVLQGRTVTSYPSIQTDLKNAGANWVDQEVVTDMGLVTSRKPADIPAFSRELVEEVGEGIHNRQKTAA